MTNEIPEGMLPFDLTKALAGWPVIWKPVKNYETRYEVSNTGLIRSKQLKVINKLTGTYSVRKSIIKKQRINFSSYKTVTLCKNYKSQTLYVHRLIAEAFIPNPHKLPQVNHIDGNKLNNNIENLEWVTASQNIIHAIKTGLLPIIGRKLNMKQVKKIRKLKQKLSNLKLAKLYKVSKRTIQDIAQMKSYLD